MAVNLHHDNLGILYESEVTSGCTWIANAFILEQENGSVVYMRLLET